jgi:uncharacterized protein
MSFDLLFLFGAGFFGGILNSIAGGGSFFTFPALIFVGISPISANATNTFASCAGYMSGAYALREDLTAYKKQLPQIVSISLLGGIIGAWLLLHTPKLLFQEAIPWLLLFATILFIYGSKLNSALKRLATHHQHMPAIGIFLLSLMLLGVSIYGGFFNAGLGIIILSYLALAGYSNINSMNAIKLLISSVVSLIAITLFIYNDLIAWYEGLIVMLGTLAGGYVAAKISRQLSQQFIRAFVIIASSCITLYFFLDTYFYH